MITRDQAREGLPIAVEGAGLQQDRRMAPAKRCIQLYGWDSRSNVWHGPDELGLAGVRPQRLEQALKSAPGRSWYGPVSCSIPGEPANRFFAVIHGLADCGVAMIYCDESRTGPVELITIVPAAVRPFLRPDFAFELVSFASFLGSVCGNANLAIIEGITTALGETPPSDSLVFSICTGLWESELDYALSRCVEKIAVAMLDWLEKP